MIIYKLVFIQMYNRQIFFMTDVTLENHFLNEWDRLV
jgi:hypothetical protein